MYRTKECHAHAVIVVLDTRAYWYPLVQQAMVRSLEVAPKDMVRHFQWPRQDGALNDWRYPKWAMIAYEVDFRTSGEQLYFILCYSILISFQFRVGWCCICLSDCVQPRYCRRIRPLLPFVLFARILNWGCLGVGAERDRGVRGRYVCARSRSICVMYSVQNGECRTV